MNELPWIKLAKAYLGLKEVKGTQHNPTIIHIHQPVYNVHS